jgi:hypothetical protein
MRASNALNSQCGTSSPGAGLLAGTLGGAVSASHLNAIILALRTACSSSLLDMSSDPFADLASSTKAFAREFREFMSRNPWPAPGSPADKEAQGEPFAGDWGEHPSSDIFATTYLAATSCTDHLLGLADVLSSRNALFAAYTLTRSAVEAAALGCYLTDQDIEGRERVRRTMNYRLDAMCERVWLFTDMQGDYAAEKLDETKERIADFARGARQHSFIFRDMNGKGRAAYVGSEQPKAMTLISLAVDKDMPELGRTYQRLLSATAHSGVHGLARMLTPVSPNEGRPGEALATVNIDPRTLAVELVVGPLTAHSLASGIEWFTGCDMTGLHGPANQMLRTWSRIGRMNVPMG